MYIYLLKTHCFATATWTFYTWISFHIFFHFHISNTCQRTYTTGEECSATWSKHKKYEFLPAIFRVLVTEFLFLFLFFSCCLCILYTWEKGPARIIIVGVWIVSQKRINRFLGNAFNMKSMQKTTHSTYKIW